MVCIRPPRSQQLTTSSILPTAAPRLESHCRGNRCQLSAARRLTACFMSASAANCLLASCCLKGPKRRTGYGATAENVRTHLPSWSCTLRFPSLGLPKKHLAQKRFKTDAVMKEAVTSWLQIRENFSYAGIQTLVLRLEKNA